MTEEERYLSTGEAARQLGTSAQTVRRLIKSGQLRAHRLAWHWRIPESAIDEFLQRQAAQQQEPAE